jgi:hypothetical protein
VIVVAAFPLSARALRHTAAALTVAKNNFQQLPGFAGFGDDAGPPPPPPSPLDALEAAIKARDGMGPPGSEMTSGAVLGGPLVTQNIADLAASMASKQLPGVADNISQSLSKDEDTAAGREAQKQASALKTLEVPPKPGSPINDTQLKWVVNASNETKAAALNMSMVLSFEKKIRELELEKQVLANQLRKATSTTTTQTVKLVHGPPPPPPCAAPPWNLTSADVRMALAPFKPRGAIGRAMKMQDGGIIWKLENGGWAFQYTNMAARVEGSKTIMAWAKMNYAVEMDEDGVSYHLGDTVVHRGVDGSLVYQRPTGTVHHVGDTLIYHWCSPNVVVYQTPSGIMYYDKDGMTYRGAGIAHYSPTGDVLYEGPSGITHMFPNGAVTHWTSSGAIYRHPDGTFLYTPTGESTPHALTADQLGPDPFPGPPLSVEQVLKYADQAKMMLPKPAPEVMPLLDPMLQPVPEAAPTAKPPVVMPPGNMSLEPPPDLDAPPTLPHSLGLKVSAQTEDAVRDRAIQRHLGHRARAYPPEAAQKAKDISNKRKNDLFKKATR